MSTIKIIDCTNGTETERAMNEIELQNYENDLALASELIAQRKQAAKNHKSAIDKLSALGLTADEIAALVG
jgi:SOS response regulatory protein OraA/RecX